MTAFKDPRDRQFVCSTFTSLKKLTETCERVFAHPRGDETEDLERQVEALEMGVVNLKSVIEDAKGKR